MYNGIEIPTLTCLRLPPVAKDSSGFFFVVLRFFGAFWKKNLVVRIPRELA